MAEWLDEVSLNDCVVKATTDKAVLFTTEDNQEFWIPQSCISDNSEVWKTGQRGELVVARWWAVKNGLAED